MIHIFKNKNHFIHIVFILFFPLTGCVSLDFKKVSGLKSQEAKWVNPSPPFQKVETEQLDQKWSNKKNGNIISFLSDCENPTDPSLENIFKGITSEIENTAIIHSGEVDYNARKALHSVVEGQVDGVATRFELMIFKKNNCTYILTYAAAAGSFSENQRDFANFVKGFKVP